MNIPNCQSDIEVVGEGIRQRVVAVGNLLTMIFIAQTRTPPVWQAFNFREISEKNQWYWLYGIYYIQEIGLVNDSEPANFFLLENLKKLGRGAVKS